MDRTASRGESPSYRYLRLADEMEHKIMGGVYQVGEKLPSLRRLHDQTGLSISTVYHAYIELEKRGTVEPRQKSGFYVKPKLRDILPVPRMERPDPKPSRVSRNQLIASIHETALDSAVLQMGGAVIAPELLPYKELLKSTAASVNRNLKATLATYGDTLGLRELRRQVSKRMLGVSRQVTPDEIIITHGCMEAIGLCLRAVAQPGDTIAVESPTFHCLFQLIKDLNMFALEIATDPETGVDYDNLNLALDRHAVKAAIFIPNFQNPLGCTMPDEKKEAVVDLMAERNVPIIEDNIFGDLHFGKKRPSTLKSYDNRGTVLHCGSVSKTLAPGLRVGWALPGIYKERVQRLKINATISTATLNQLMVAEFLKTGGYDRHMRRLRRSLQNQICNTARAIARYFPTGTKITAPEGGMLLWVQLGGGADGLAVFHEARRQQIAILPGIVCSTTNKYQKFIRIACGNPWSDKVEQGIARLGEIVTSLAKSRRGTGE